MSYNKMSSSEIFTTLEVSLGIGFVLLTIFECFRHRESFRFIYQARAGDLSHRSPEKFPSYPCSWFIPVHTISGRDILHYCGLDAYMFVRYLQLCRRICFFAGFLGLVILMPLYSRGAADDRPYYHLTLVNVDQGSDLLYVTIPFAYIFMIYVLYLLKSEFRSFAQLRNEFLAEGDPDLVSQTMYTVVVERIPPECRSNNHLGQFFESLFPGKVHSVQICLKMEDLEIMVSERDNMLMSIERRQIRRSLSQLSTKELHALEEDELILVTLNEMIENEQKKWMEVALKADEGFSAAELEEMAKEEEIEVVPDHPTDLDADPLHLDLQKSVQTFSQSFQESFNNQRGCCAKLCDGLTMCCKASVTRAGEEAALGVNLLTRGSYTGASKLATVISQLAPLGGLRIGEAVSSTGFVTFRTLTAKAAAAQMVLTPHPKRFQVDSAPEPRDVIWKNVAVPQARIEIRRSVINIILVFGVILWSVPVAFIQAVASMENLAQWLDIPSVMDKNSYVYNLLAGYLPVVALLGIMQLLPIIFQALEIRYVHAKSKSAVQTAVMVYVFYYQVANVYISITSGTIFQALSDILEKPVEVLFLLGNALPTVSVYFLDVLIVKICVGLPMELVRVWPLLRMSIIRLFWDTKNLTVRQAKKGIFRPPELQYGWYYPDQLFVVLIIFIYSVISPIILPVGFVYFWFATTVFKYQILNCYIPSYESGGCFFFHVYNHTLVALVTAQLTLLGYLILKEGWKQLPYLFFLPIITIWYGLRTGSEWSNTSSKLSLEKAIALDKLEARPVSSVSPTVAGLRTRLLSADFREDAYIQPALRSGAVVPNPQLAFREDESLLTEEQKSKLNKRYKYEHIP